MIPIHSTNIGTSKKSTFAWAMSNICFLWRILSWLFHCEIVIIQLLISEKSCFSNIIDCDRNDCSRTIIRFNVELLKSNILTLFLIKIIDLQQKMHFYRNLMKHSKYCIYLIRPYAVSYLPMYSCGKMFATRTGIDFLKFILSFKKYVLLIIGYLGYFGFRTVQYRIQLDKTFKYKVNYV